MTNGLMWEHKSIPLASILSDIFYRCVAAPTTRANTLALQGQNLDVGDKCIMIMLTKKRTAMTTTTTIMRDILKAPDVQMSSSLNFVKARKEGLPMKAKRVGTSSDQTMLRQRQRRGAVPMPRFPRRWSWEGAWRELGRTDGVM